jgi:saccharopine dehydrogenase-like NADP-dependent oxidoreductase
VAGFAFAPSFSIWTTIEECLNPPVVWERGARLVHHCAVQRAGGVRVPRGIGPVECVNVEHEEVLLVPRWIDAGAVTFKYGLGRAVHRRAAGAARRRARPHRPVRVGGVEVSPRDVVAACLPDPATLGDRMSGKTCAGTWVKGTGKDGQPREVYLYHVVDNADSMRDYGAQAVVWQTAINPVVALELIAGGTLVRLRASRPRRPSTRCPSSSC